MKRLLIILIILSTIRLAGQPANNNCLNAINLTVNGPLLCGQNMAGSNLEANECTIGYAGGTATGASVWYSFTATTSSMVLNYINTNTPPFCRPSISVFGPFASVAGGCSTAGVFGAPCGGAPAYNWSTNNNYQGSESPFYLYSNGDPGNHPLLTGLTVGGVYLIRIQGATGGIGGSACGGAATLPIFCVSIATPAVNSSPPAALPINACGVTFTGTTNGGYYNNGLENGGGFGQLDNNMGTTCPSCVTPGDDVNFVVNNLSWYTFCAGASAGTWNVQFSVSNCVLTGANSGAQIAVFTGTPTALNQVWQSPPSCGGLGNGQVPSGCTVTSSNFNVPANGCAYMVVDGFAGDACNYSIILTNVLGGCILPVELTDFSAKCVKGKLVCEWGTASEKNSDYFIVEKSLDGVNFYPVGEVKAAGTSNTAKKYFYVMKEALDEVAYYRLSERALNGTIKTFNTIAVKGCEEQKFVSWASENKINVSVTSKIGGHYQVELYNHSGNLVMTSDQTYAPGNSTAVIPANVETGVYYLRIMGDQETESKKIFLQK